MAPHTPRRSEDPGEAGALLDLPRGSTGAPPHALCRLAGYLNTSLGSQSAIGGNRITSSMPMSWIDTKGTMPR